LVSEKNYVHRQKLVSATRIVRIKEDGVPPANEHRPQPQVETATARCHSSHHNDSQIVFWFCQNWQQHQMISPRKMKMTVNQGN
jgi:hypothetical protein